jgi:multidrug efflux pump subunit AcrA (membrane-fusion protein)
VKKWGLIAAVVLLVLAAAGWGTMRLYRNTTPTPDTSIPTTMVRRGDVKFAVVAKGELAGGNSEMLYAPMVGGGALAITSLRESGELVKEGDVVVEFDTTEQEFKLREAEADLAEAEQHVIFAESESKALEEEARYALLKARSELKIAELETRRNEMVPKMVAQQNILAVEAAKEKVEKLEKDFGDRLATAKAGIAIHQAGRAKAKVMSDTAQRNINSMTLKTKTGGYVARQSNQDGNFRWGSYLPALQVGDTVRAGMAVAQIPDLKNWEVTARIGELDRGHLATGQPTDIRVVALPGREYHGKLKSMGGTTGPPWDRYFETRFTIENPSAELRPGLSARLVVTTDVMKNVLWLPSQALFEASGRKFVYVQSGATFTPADAKLVRRSESQVVIEGLPEGQVVALANPDQMKKTKRGVGGAMQAIQR